MSHPLAYFQKIYIINLPARSDRRREMEAQLAAIGLSLAHPLVHLLAAIRPEEAQGFPSRGARGCFLSHLEILRSARVRQLKRLLILEDDTNFSPHFQARLSTVVAGLSQNDWSLFYGGHVLPPEAPPPARWASANGLCRIAPETPIQTTHFLAFNGLSTLVAGIETLEGMLQRPPGDPAGGPMHVDGAYNWLRQAHPGFTTLLAMPPLGYQRHSRNDIHDLKWFDRLPLARQAAGWLRHWSNP